MSKDLTLNEVADRLGVHYMTAYRYVRLGQLPARKVGTSWKVAAADFSSFQQEKVSESSPGLSRSSSNWAARLESRLVEGDQAGAWGVIEAAMTAGTEPLAVYTELVIPAMESIGERWGNGELSVADEHVASAAAARLIGRLGPRFARRGRKRGTVVVAGPPGERHGLGLSMVADALRGDGYEVIDLGPDTPLESLVSTLERSQRLRGVCIGVSSSGSLESARAMVAAVRAALPENVAILVGGRAVAETDAAAALGADGTATVGTVGEVLESLANPEDGRAGSA
ncbi:hypothetical protein BH23ACT5_BH23ACT5_04430 [soil metagenome]